LLEGLSKLLESITGDSGKGSFNLSDVCVPRALFVIARNQNGEAVGCGAIRPIGENIAEVKRMYAKIRGMGIGTEILTYLEIQAQKLRYSALWLETHSYLQ
jgi:N-acetylglutamate synthase-like GNAT family acetyltransferase